MSGGDLFQSSLDSVDWSGHFERYALAAGGVGLASTAPSSWDAGAILTGTPGYPPIPTPAERTIFTSIVQADGALSMVPFTWNALSVAQQMLLDVAPPAASASGAKSAVQIAAQSAARDGLGERRIAYLRGERALEGKLFRPRGSVLGDSINSTPVFVGAPSGIATSADYQAFYNGHKTRRGAVYLGANDGMLHAFDAISGKEIFAYVPDALIATLNRLPSPAYVHRTYVDGPAAAAEAVLAGVWKTVLVSGMGGGAQGVFALDVSDPEQFAAGGALWEFTDRDDPMMGNVTTLPQIVKARTRLVGGVATYRYFAVVASGLNNYAADGHSSAAGKGALFLLALDKAHDAAWQLNVNYYRLITPISDATLANGLSAPALVADRDGILRYAYAGDLQGNLWRFDFSGSAPWASAVGPGAGKTPLFFARDAGGKRQPITQQPLLVFANGGGYLVLFGTGRMIDKADRSAATFAPQSYYAILDTLDDPAVLVGGRSELTQRFFIGAADGTPLGIGGGDIEPGSKGWYVDFLQSGTTGERSISSGTLMGGELLFNTLVPAADVCGAPSGRTYALNVLSGLTDDSSVVMAPAVGDIVGTLLPNYAPVPMLLPVTAISVQSNAAGVTRVQKSFSVVNAGVPGVTQALGKITIQQRAGRLSWREVANWRQLHEAAK